MLCQQLAECRGRAARVYQIVFRVLYRGGTGAGGI